MLQCSVAPQPTQAMATETESIQDMLRRLAELEQRVVEAESRAEEAEDKVRMMEQRLNEAEWASGESMEQCCNVHQAVQEKEQVITRLETQVEEQRQLRIQDAKQVEAKAAKIKEWVTNKLKELEVQNQHLRQQNQKCTQQLELLRNRMAHISNSKQRDRQSTEDSSRGSFDGDRLPSDESPPPDAGLSLPLSSSPSPGQQPRPQRPSSVSAITASLRRRRDESAGRTSCGSSSGNLSNRASHPLESGDVDLLYAQVKRRTESPGSRSSSPSVVSGTVTPPRSVNLERKRYPDAPAGGILVASDGESGGAVPRQPHQPNSREQHDRERDSGSVDLETPQSLSPKSPLEVLDAALPMVPAPSASRLEELDSPRRTKPVPAARCRAPARRQQNSPSPDMASFVSDYNCVNERVVQAPELHELQAAVQEIISSSGASRITARVRAADEIHDYAEIYTPSKERSPWPGSSSSSHGPDVSEESWSKPPTPPLHRFPSWESRIYQVAADGLTVAEQLLNGSRQSDSTNNNRMQPPNGSSGGYYEISVPVYATVKGRASQIRSMPFTGDSSDSSDGEEHSDLRGTSSGSGSGSGSHPASSGDTDTSLSAASPGKSVKTSSSLSPAKHNNSSPSKSPRRDTSFESGMSDDYAIPPDAFGSDTTSIDSTSLPSLLLRSSCVDSPRKESLEKSGYLTKLGGKLKTWRKRYFVLKNGVLTYWKSQNDVSRKPQGQIVLNDVCRVTRADGAATFEITTDKKVYYLTAESIATMEDWVRVLQNVLRRNTTKLLLSREDNRPTIQGWLTKVKNGHGKRCWCVLLGKMFLYFKNPNDVNPNGQINMRDARVEEVGHVSDSDSEERENEANTAELTIGIFPSHQGPSYLLMPSKQDKDAWLYHLTVVSGGSVNVGTQYEQLVQKLMEMDGDPNCVLWRHPHLMHSKESITSPLTTMTSESLQAEAVKLFKSCQLFMSVHLDSAGIDYHVVLAQNALQQCLDLPELQPELICALIKQTSRHTQQKLGVQVNRTLSKIKHSRQLLLCATQSLFMCDSSSTQKCSPPSLPQNSSPVHDSKTNPPLFVFIQGWQLLALAISLFVPKNNRLLWYLKLHLQRNADTKVETGKYAAYCQRALERTIENGSREAKPSRMEVLSILLKNPYHHSLPHSIPVHFPNGTYQVVGFDGSTTVEEFLTTLNLEIGCRDTNLSGFALFSDDPIEKDLEHYLNFNVKLCDVISKWETALREKGSGKFENTRVIQLSFKNRLYWRLGCKSETDKERLLLCYQVNQQIISSRFPLTKELSLELASLMAQIDYGDYNSDKGRGSGGQSGNPHHHVQQAIEKFYPLRYKENISPEETKVLLDNFTDKWASLKGKSMLDCIRIYLTCTRKWPYFGATLFQATVRSGEQSTIYLAVAEDSVTFLDTTTLQSIVKYPYKAIVTFGGCQEDFMMVVNLSEAEGARVEGSGTQKLLFSLSKPKILELTLLIADYMNAMGKPFPGTPQTGTLTRHGSHRSARSRCAGASPRLGAEPDILKSTPDMENKLQRSDSKKRTHVDSGVI